MSCAVLACRLEASVVVVYWGRGVGCMTNQVLQQCMAAVCSSICKTSSAQDCNRKWFEMQELHIQGFAQPVTLPKHLDILSWWVDGYDTCGVGHWVARTLLEFSCGRANNLYR